MKVYSSIWDYPKAGLCPDVWDNDLNLKQEIEDLIISNLYAVLISKGKFKPEDLNKLIKDIYIVGSLTSYQWNSKTDLDVHVVIDTDFYPYIDKLNDEVRKYLNRLLLRVPGTEHPIEFYFEDYKHLQPFEGIYSIFEHKWLKPPHVIDDDFNPETFYRARLDVIKDFASHFDIKIGNIERILKDIDFLKETLRVNPKVDYWQSFFKKKIDELEKEIEDYIDLGESVIEQRHKNYSRESDANLLFKYLQRYQYLWLAKQLEAIYNDDGIVEEDVVKVKEKLKEFKGGLNMERKRIKIAQDIPAEDNTSNVSDTNTSPSGVSAFNEKPSMDISDKRTDLFTKKERPRKEEEIEVPEEKKEIMKDFQPTLPSKLNPLDRQRFLTLEKQRKMALETGDKALLEWVNEEEIKIMQKYEKEPIKSDELSGLNFASRKMEARMAMLSDLDKKVYDAIKVVERTLRKMSVQVVRASLYRNDKDYLNDRANYELVFFLRKYSGKHNKPVIIQAYYDGKQNKVVVMPYFWDLDGNKYSLDKATLASYLEEKIEYKMNREWYEEFFDKNELKTLEKSSSFIPTEEKIKKYASNYLYITDRVVEQIAEVFDEEEEFVRKVLSSDDNDYVNEEEFNEILNKYPEAKEFLNYLGIKNYEDYKKYVIEHEPLDITEEYLLWNPNVDCDYEVEKDWYEGWDDDGSFIAYPSGAIFNVSFAPEDWFEYLFPDAPWSYSGRPGDKIIEALGIE